MPNITLAISEDLHARMRQHSEIRWSEVVRKTITQKIEDLDVMDKLTAKNKLQNLHDRHIYAINLYYGNTDF